MTTSQLQAAKERLELGETALARLLGVNERTARRWASGDAPVPAAASKLLRLLLSGKLSLEDIKQV